MQDLALIPFHFLNSFTSPDDYWNGLMNLALPIIDKHAPVKVRRIKQSSLLWMTDYILDLIHQKESLIRRFRHTGAPDLWFSYKLIRNRLTSVIRQAKKDFVESAPTTPDGKSCSIHIALRKLLPSKNKTLTNSFKVDTKLITDPLHLTNSMNISQLLAKVFMTLIANPATLTPMIPCPLRLILLSFPCNLFPRTMLPQ